MKLIYNAIKESKLVPKYPEIIGVFENNLDAVTMLPISVAAVPRVKGDTAAR